MNSHFRRILATLLLLILFCTSSLAQSTRGTLTGVVTDAQGAVIKAATVTLTSPAMGEVRTVSTGPNGEYRIDALNPGSYNVAVEASGFAKSNVTGIIIKTSQTTSNNVQLGVASAKETLVVEGSTDTIQTDTGELSKTIPATQIKDLPIFTGNPFSLATTLPGVQEVSNRDSGLANGAAFVVNGLRPRSNNFLIDGFDDNDNGIAGQAYQPTNQEAIQEVTVLTNSYSAEYGRGGASVSNLTFKSGTNSFHGGAWWSYDGSRLDSISTQQKLAGSTRVPQYTNNTLGFRIGGPVIKNKLFFFGTSQWNHNIGVSTFASPLEIPTAQGVEALQALSGTNPNANYIIQTLGGVTGQSAGASSIDIGTRAGCPAASLLSNGNCGVEVGSFLRSDHAASKSYDWTARADYMPSSSDSIYVRFTNSYQTFSPDLFANITALPNEDTQQGGPARLLGTMWAHSFNANVINEFRFSAQQIDFSFAPKASTLAFPLANGPTVAFNDSFGGIFGAYFGGYSDGTWPQGRGHKTFQFQDAVSINHGNHAIKAGVDLAILLINDQIPFNSNGLITFSSGGDCSAINITGGTGCTDLANLLDDFTGPSGSANKQFGNPRISVPTSQQAYYVQDTWRVRPNFTVDLGLRYEYQPPDAENVLPYPALDRATLFTTPLNVRIPVKPDRNNFGPRVGFAYTPHWGRRIFGDDKTVLRAGYGIFYDTFFTNIADNSASGSPNTLGGNLVSGVGRGVQNPFAQTNAITPTYSDQNGAFLTVNNLVNPQIHQWNVSIQRELPWKLFLETAYVGTRGMRLWVNEDLNPGDFTTGNVVNPNFGTTDVRGNRGDSVYHGLETTVSHTMNRLTMRASYTWSKSLDNGSEVFTTSGGSSFWQNVRDPRSDRGPSAFDRRQRFSLAYVYDLPQFSGHGVLSAILGGWSTSGNIAFATGTPQNIYLGYDQNGDFHGGNDRPTWGNPSAPLNYSAACLGDTTGTCITGVGFDDGSGNLVDINTGAPGTINQFRYIGFDPSLGRNGNVSRNNFTWPGTQTWNLTARKLFKMPYREGHTVEIRGDFFNAFNHKNDAVTSNINQGGDILNPHFMDPGFFRDGNRNITLWLKYYF
jgi:Carboxypeptidase regulatory-like domain/TonB-dependent Receptor Plug Domain